MGATRCAQINGGFPKLARTAGLNAEFMRQIAKSRRRASPTTAIAIEAATTGAVTREERKPDILASLNSARLNAKARAGRRWQAPGLGLPRGPEA